MLPSPFHQLVYCDSCAFDGENMEEKAKPREAERIIVGNDNPEKCKADCGHIFEAQKYGYYFVCNQTY